MNEKEPRASVLQRLIGRLRAVPLLTPAKRRGRYVGASLVALVAVGSIAQIAVAHATALPHGAVFQLGDTVLTEQQYDQRVRVLEVLYGVKPPKDKKKLDQYRRATAKAIAVSDILERAKQADGVTIADKQASDELDKMLRQKFPAGGRQQFTTALGQAGISERNVLDEIKRQLGNSQLFDKVTHSVPPATEADTHKYYSQHRAQMVQPEMRHLRNIVVDTEQKADQALQRLKSGEDFAGVAREVSMDASTKNKGGDLGTVAKQQLDPAYGNAAFAAVANGFFGPIKTKQGWHVGQVLEKKPAVTVPFEQVKEQLTDKVNTDRKLKVWNSWLDSRIRSADIQYADKYQPKDPDTAPQNGVPR